MGNRFRARFIYVILYDFKRSNEFRLSSYTLNSSDINNTRWTNKTRSRIQNMATATAAAPTPLHCWINIREHTRTHMCVATVRTLIVDTSRHAGFECCCVTFFCQTYHTKKRIIGCCCCLYWKHFLFWLLHFKSTHTHIHTWTHIRICAIGNTTNSRTREPTSTNIGIAND